MTIIETILDRIATGLETLRSAGAVAHAFETGRQPASRDLLTLGIDPRAFSTIGHG